MFIWSLVLVVLLFCVLLPLEWIASLFLSAETIDSTLRAFRYGASTFVPFMLVTLCRYFDVNMFESAFFAGLARRDAQLAELIQQVKLSIMSRHCDAFPLTICLCIYRKRLCTGTGNTCSIY